MKKKGKLAFFIAATIATALSLPFIALSSFYMWQAHLAYSLDHQAAGFIFSICIYLLGSPLTLLAGFLIPEDIGRLYGDAVTRFIVVADVLFLLQWIIWSQLIVRVYRKVRKNRS